MGSYEQAAAGRDAALQAGPAGPPDERPRHVIRAADRWQVCAYGLPEPCYVDTDCRSDCGEDACRYCGMSGDTFTVREGPGGVDTYTCAECERQWTA